MADLLTLDNFRNVLQRDKRGLVNFVDNFFQAVNLEVIHDEINYLLLFFGVAADCINDSAAGVELFAERGRNFVGFVRDNHRAL